MRVGDIYIWHFYPHQKDGEVKDRWFLFLGEVRNDPFDKVGYGQFQLLAGEEPAKSYTEDLKALPLRMMATLRKNRGGSVLDTSEETSFVTQGLDGVHEGGFVSGVKAEEDADEGGKTEGQQDR